MKLTHYHLIRTHFLKMFLVVVLTFFGCYSTSMQAQISTINVECGSPIPSFSPRGANLTPWCFTFNIGAGQSRLYSSSTELGSSSRTSKFIISGIPSTIDDSFQVEKSDFVENNDGTAVLFGTIVNETQKDIAFNYIFWLTKKGPGNIQDPAASRLASQFGIKLENLNQYVIDYSKQNSLSGIQAIEGSNLKFNPTNSEIFSSLSKDGKEEMSILGNLSLNGTLRYRGVDNSVSNLNLRFNSTNRHHLCPVPNPCHQTLLRICFVFNSHFCLSIHMQIININDTTPPTFVETLPADVAVSCDAIPAVPVLTAIDNCTDTTVSYKQVASGEGCSYEIYRIWTAEDACGNVRTHKQTIVVNDNQGPTFVEALPADVAVSCDAIPAVPVLTAIDNCSDAGVIYKETRTDGNCESNYVLIRIWTATDACGNVTSHKQTINVQDTTAPAFVEALPMDMTVECDAVPMAMTLTATDNCSEVGVQYAETRTDGNCPSNYTLARTWTATDACGNMTMYTQTITVRDTTIPVFTGDLPQNMTVECDAVPMPATVTAIDNCSEPTILFFETRVDGGCPNQYTLVRLWKANDGCGNFAFHKQTIEVQDTTAPTFVEELPMDVTVECDAVPMAMTLTATDNCSEVGVEYAETRTDGNCESNYVLIRIWTATDACGNVTSHKQTINVQDTIAPAFVEALPMNTTVECDAVPMAMTLTATDNCSEVGVQYAETRTNGNCPSNYTLARTWTAADACGNMTMHTQTISVRDTTKPVFTGNLPQNMTVECNAVPMPATVTAIDNCSEPTILFFETRVNGGCPNQYTLVRLWKANDGCGNFAFHKQTIEVQDTTAPTFVGNLPADVAVSCNAIPSIPTITAVDNCGTANVTYKEVASGEGCSYEIYRIWTTEDACGNVRTHKQTIVVSDTVKPTFVGNLPVDVAVSCNAIPSIPTITAIDNCGKANVTYKEVASGEGCSYEIYRIWTAEDACGNLRTHKQTIVVSDTVKPTFVGNLPADVAVSCDAIPVRPTITATDNCGAVSVTYKEVASGEGCSYEIYRIWTAEDTCGNVRTHKQTIVVSDNVAPTFVGNLPADVAVACGAVPVRPTITATDNCSEVEMSYKEVRSNDNECGYELYRIWTAQDDCGNTITHKQTIVVQDSNNEPTSFSTAVSFEAYPIPFYSQVTIKYSFEYSSPVQIEVYDIKGALLKNFNDANGYMNKEYKIDLSSLGESHQIYILRVTTNRGSEIKKIVSAVR